MNVGESMAGDVGVDVVTTSTKERSYTPAFSWGQHGEPANARAAQDPDEHSLRPVVGVVTGRDPVGSHSASRVLQCLPTRVPSASLEVSSLDDNHAGSAERHVERMCKILCDVELSPALRAKAMVYAVGEKAESAAASKTSQHIQKSD